MTFVKIKLLVLTLLVSAGISAKEYHVSVKGNDSDDGSAAKPFRTINQAAQTAMPGDVVIVHAGVYREQIAPPRGGNSDTERIVYEAAPGEKVEIKGSEIIKGWEKLDGDTWTVKIPNTFFGQFNPYADLIRGDWFNPTPKDRKYHTGAVYLNGDWLMEAYRKEEVTGPADEKNPLWWAEADSTFTTIWAQFKNADPNRETVEINVRQSVFYPDKPFINFITVRGFVMQHAATNWAPPTAEQKGLIGTHWSRGWIIENNVVQYSKCVGIALGKHGDEFDNTSANSAEGYVATINRALAFGWNKGTIGGHIVRNNTVAYCEQAGIVGSMGCAFSTVEGNTIHDIHIRRLFTGAEMAGIKFHGAIDVQIRNNHIYRTCLGIWLDWMAQDTQVESNLLHDNFRDIFLEVNHGPTLVSNNILLSESSLLMNTKGAAFVHNLFAGKIDVYAYDRRLTPWHKPHSTFVAALHDNAGGDIRFINNLFVNGANAGQYYQAILPVTFNGNVFTKEAKRPVPENYDETDKRVSQSAKEKKLQPATEKNTLDLPDFDAQARLTTEGDAFYLEIVLDKKWLDGQKRELVTSELLGKVLIPDLPFENPDGSAVVVDTDYTGRKRNVKNPSPGPLEISASGKQKIKVW
jgi:alpha-N-arabinofuranosidase